MRGRRFGALGVLVAAFFAVGMVAALATSGTGKTHEGATLGFNAKPDLTGNLEYQSLDGTFNVHCDGYTFYKQGTNSKGQPVVHVRATCTEQGTSMVCGSTGDTVYLVGDFVDRGEPGTNDGTNIFWSCSKPVLQNAFIADQGKIQNGNIQIKGDPANPVLEEAYMLSTV